MTVKIHPVLILSSLYRSVIGLETRPMCERNQMPNGKESRLIVGPQFL